MENVFVKMDIFYKIKLVYNVTFHFVYFVLNWKNVKDVQEVEYLKIIILVSAVKLRTLLKIQKTNANVRMDIIIMQQELIISIVRDALLFQTVNLVAVAQHVQPVQVKYLKYLLEIVSALIQSNMWVVPNVKIAPRDV